MDYRFSPSRLISSLNEVRLSSFYSVNSGEYCSLTKDMCCCLLCVIFQVEGVEGIMAAYTSALHNVGLAGPTLFGQVINKAADIAGHSLSRHEAKYYVLLIITVSI